MSGLHALARSSRRRLRSGLILGLFGGAALSACSDGLLPTQVSDLEAPEAAMAPADTPTGLRSLRPESILAPGDASFVGLTDDNGVPVDASEVTWTSGLTTIATVSSSGMVRAVSPGTVVITARRGGAVAQHHVVVVGGGASQLRLSPRESILFPGEGDQLGVTDGSGNDVAAGDVAWSSSSPAVATVSSSGRITAVSGGAAVITVRRGSGVAQHGVIVVGSQEPPPPGKDDPAGLKVSPRESVLGRGDVSNPRVTDGAGNPVDDKDVDWVSGLPTVATVSSDGLVRGVSPGVAVIVARSGSQVAFHQAVVVGGGGSEIRLSSGESDLAPGESAELTVFDADGDPVPSSEVSWSSSPSGIVTISSSGVIRAVADGAAVVTARRGAGVAQHGVLVGDGGGPTQERSLQSVRGDDQSAATGSQVPTPPTVRLVDGSGNGIQGVSVRWSVLSGGGSVSSTSTTTNASGETSVAWTLGTTAGAQALQATADGAGSVRFDATATSGGDTGIQITRKESVLSPGDVSRLQVVDESGRAVEASEVSWSSGSSEVATVSSGGLVTGVASGTVVIAARRGSAVAHHSAVVVGGGSSALRIQPRESALSIGEVRQLGATDALGNRLDPATVSWSSSSSAVASISSSGQVTARSAGIIVITGRRNGFLAQHSVLVTGDTPSPQVDRIRVSPGSSSLEEGASVQLQATALDRSGNTVSVAFNWSSDRPDIASVSASGRVLAVTSGSTTIRVSADGVTATHAVTVESAPAPTPPPTGWNEPAGYSLLLDEGWDSFDTNNWWHRITNSGNVETQNGKVVWTYTAGMEGGHTPGGMVVKDVWHGPYEYQRDEGVRLSSNFHGHQSGVNKFRYWAGLWPRAYMGFFGSGDGELTLGMNSDGWPEGEGKLRWDTPANRASPTRAQARIRRGVDHDIETLTYVGTAGNHDGWIKVWLDGVLILHFVDLAIVPEGERAQLSQVHLAPVWGGIGDAVPATQTLSIDRTYVSVR